MFGVIPRNSPRTKEHAWLTFEPLNHCFSKNDEDISVFQSENWRFLIKKFVWKEYVTHSFSDKGLKGMVEIQSLISLNGHWRHYVNSHFKVISIELEPFNTFLILYFHSLLPGFYPLHPSPSPPSPSQS